MPGRAKTGRTTNKFLLSSCWICQLVKEFWRSAVLRGLRVHGPTPASSSASGGVCLPRVLPCLWRRSLRHHRLPGGLLLASQLPDYGIWAVIDDLYAHGDGSPDKLAPCSTLRWFPPHQRRVLPVASSLAVHLCSTPRSLAAQPRRRPVHGPRLPHPFPAAQIPNSSPYRCSVPPPPSTSTLERHRASVSVHPRTSAGLL
jgi:hypothetical protein